MESQRGLYKKYAIGVLIIRIGFRGTFCYNYVTRNLLGNNYSAKLANYMLELQPDPANL